MTLYTAARAAPQPQRKSMESAAAAKSTKSSASETAGAPQKIQNARKIVRPAAAAPSGAGRSLGQTKVKPTPSNPPSENQPPREPLPNPDKTANEPYRQKPAGPAHQKSGT